MYYVEVSKLVETSWLYVPVNSVGGVGRSKDWSLPRSAGVQDNLEVIHANIRSVCVSLHKISGVFLSLRLV